jgi:farnesyl-diphosphate farnesyltransferase
LAALSQSQQADAFCREILPSVSRTFALSIRLLPGELGAAVRDAYLLCRIADTLEDAPELAAEEKAELLTLFRSCFDDVHAPRELAARAQQISGDAAHLRLTRGAELVFQSFAARAEESRTHIRRWVQEMADGMRKFVLRYPRGIRIQTLDEYREYCYYVAGTVGYLLTDLWRAHSSTIDDARYDKLRAKAREFAEALQTVNILKDVATDAESENSIYVPEQVLRLHGSAHATILAPELLEQNRQALGALIELAWHDLEEAKAYLLLIPRRAVSIRMFCALPLLFAYATLRDLTRNPDALARRVVVKISRREVKSITLLSFMSVTSNSALRWLVARTRDARYATRSVG